MQACVHEQTHTHARLSVHTKKYAFRTIDQSQAAFIFTHGRMTEDFTSFTRISNEIFKQLSLPVLRFDPVLREQCIQGHRSYHSIPTQMTQILKLNEVE